MLNKLIGLLLSSCSWLALPCWGQSRVLEGLVLDARTQQPVPFATVGVPQQPLGTAASEAGTFRLVLPDGATAPALVVSSVGYEAATVPLANWPAGRQTIRLHPASVALGQVVVRGGKVKTKTFGRTATSTFMVARMYTEPDLISDELGREQGTVVPVDPYCVVRDVNFFVAFNRFQAVKFRLQLYTVRQGLPDRPLLRRNVFVDVTQPRGWVRVDLQADSLVLRGLDEVAVTLQWVQSQAKEGSAKAFGVAAVPTPGHGILFRDKSQAPWRSVKPGNLSLYLTADSYQAARGRPDENRPAAPTGAADTLSQRAIDRVLGTGGSRPPSTHHYGDSAAVGRYVPVAGGRLYYEQYGQGQPLVLLHGNGQSISAFSQQIGALAQRFRVIAVDTRAQGKSQDATNAPLSYRLFADDLRQLLDSLHLQRVALLGWSDGGNTALEMALRHPTYVSRMAIMGANLFPTNQALDPALLAILRQQLGLLRQLPEPKARTQARLYELLLTEPQLTFADLARIQAPVLVLAGEHDLVLDTHTRAIAAHLPHASCFIFPGATHNAPWEIPQEFNQRVSSFLTAP
jgi:pimeloyl-ACP methyl ester carboxylesterase